MDDRVSPREFTDVHEAVGDNWAGETTPYERIRHVIAHTYSSVSADSVAENPHLASCPGPPSTRTSSTRKRA